MCCRRQISCCGLLEECAALQTCQNGSELFCKLIFSQYHHKREWFSHVLIMIKCHIVSRSLVCTKLCSYCCKVRWRYCTSYCARIVMCSAETGRCVTSLLFTRRSQTVKESAESSSTVLSKELQIILHQASGIRKYIYIFTFKWFL